MEIVLMVVRRIRWMMVMVIKVTDKAVGKDKLRVKII